MSWTASQIAVGSIGILHAILMFCELFPWDCPLIMAIVVRKWPRQLDLSINDRHFVSMVVHNAGVYNGIVAVGLFAAASVGPQAFYIQVALLTGGVVAGLFGAATLTKATVLQAVLGAIALVIVMWFPS
jgi:uncharacterized membrane protein